MEDLEMAIKEECSAAAVISSSGDIVTADFLLPASVRQSNEESRYGKRSSELQDAVYTIHKNSVLPIHPVLDMSKYSANRTIYMI